MLGVQHQQLLLGEPDGTIWHHRQKIAQTRFTPLKIVADEDGIYLLTQQPDGAYSLEHSHDGILVSDLAPTPFPSLALTVSHLYVASGDGVLALERVP